MITSFVQGMLAHPKRYKPRTEDEGLHWHEAIAKEANELTEAVLEELSKGIS